MMTWWFTTFMAPAIKQKVHNLPGVEYLYEVMSPDQLEIPAYITEYDMTVEKYNVFKYITFRIHQVLFERHSLFFFVDKWFEVLSTGSNFIVTINIHVTRR